MNLSFRLSHAPVYEAALAHHSAGEQTRGLAAADDEAGAATCGGQRRGRQLLRRQSRHHPARKPNRRPFNLQLHVGLNETLHQSSYTILFGRILRQN